MIGLIDVGMGNIKSIENWLYRNNINWVTLTKAGNLTEYDLVILPGVGSASTFLRNLRSSGFYEELEVARRSDVRILGICLGAQVFLEKLEEDGGVEGFCWINGHVPKLNCENSNTGWLNFEFNIEDLSIFWRNNRKIQTKKKLLNGRVFYNHNYGMVTPSALKNIKNSNIKNYASIVHFENLLGFQFHPEKSQTIGDELLRMIL